MAYLYRVEFSESDVLLSHEELTALAVVWEGQIKRGDILTDIYPEDVCEDEKFFPVRADWVDYKPKFFEEVEIPPYIPPTVGEYEAAIASPAIGKAYIANKRKISGWTLEAIIPAHQEWQTTGGSSYSRESSDGMRSARSSYEPVRHHQVTIPNTYVWASDFDGYVIKTTDSIPPIYKHKYDFEWFLAETKNQYWKNYQKAEKEWLASLLDPAEEAAKAAKLAAEEAAKAAKLAAEEAAKSAKLAEAASKVDAVWQQLLIDCPRAVKKGLKDKIAEHKHKVTSRSDIAQGAIAKFGKDCYYDPAKFEREYLEEVYKSELQANRNQVLNKKGLQIDGYDYVSRIDGKQVSIKADFINKHSKRVQRYGTEGVDITKLHHISDADGVILPPVKSFEKWLASRALGAIAWEVCHRQGEEANFWQKFQSFCKNPEQAIKVLLFGIRFYKGYDHSYTFSNSYIRNRALEILWGLPHKFLDADISPENSYISEKFAIELLAKYSDGLSGVCRMLFGCGGKQVQKLFKSSTPDHRKWVIALAYGKEDLVQKYLGAECVPYKEDAVPFLKFLGEKPALRMVQTTKMTICGKSQNVTGDYVKDTGYLFNQLQDAGVSPELGRVRCWFSTHELLAKEYVKILPDFELKINSDFAPLDGVSSLDMSWELEIPKHQHQLKRYGEILSHCVGGYGAAINQGSSVIIAVYHNGILKYTLEFVKGDRKYRCNQFYGFRNSQPSESDRSVVLNMFQQAKLIN